MVRVQEFIEPNNILSCRIAQNPFMVCAAHHWGDHIRGDYETQLESLILHSMHSPPKLASAVRAEYAGSGCFYQIGLGTSRSQVLHAAVCFRIERIARFFLRNMSMEGNNWVDCRGKSALHWALEAEATDIDILLLRDPANRETPIR